MKLSPAPYIPPEKRKDLAKLRRLEWATIFGMVTVIAALGFTMGSSQAMFTAWVEDVLTLVPPIAFLIANHVSKRDPDKRFPFGYRRASSIAYLVSSVTLTGFGAFLLFEAVKTLITRKHPTIGTVDWTGEPVWLGWWMLGALAYSVIPPILLGRMKLPLARKLNERAAYADAEMNKADWQTAGAAAVGVVGLGFGLWWADAAAAGAISISILRDALRNLKLSVTDLMDREPTLLGKEEPDPLTEKLRDHFRSLPWVRRAVVRMREAGNVCLGDAEVVPRDPNDPNLCRKITEAGEAAKAIDWKIRHLVVTVRESEGEDWNELEGGEAKEGRDGAEKKT